MRGVKACKTCGHYEKPMCKRYPTEVEKKPKDWCGEYVAMDQKTMFKHLQMGATHADD